jgi:hypothetical protein
VDRKEQMDIPTIELVAHICLNRELDEDPPRAEKHVVKGSLRRMFGPFLGDRVGYEIERLVVLAKSMGLVREEGDHLVAVIERKEGEGCPTRR